MRLNGRFVNAVNNSETIKRGYLPTSPKWTEARIPQPMDAAGEFISYTDKEQ
jgi:hypothetical protein